MMYTKVMREATADADGDGEEEEELLEDRSARRAI
jgi:hypothetical protein